MLNNQRKILIKTDYFLCKHFFFSIKIILIFYHPMTKSAL